ncbi:unnamed protein product [Prorocentrum cordatum]|uniref:Glycoside hydrolase family 28 protein n=1 Tax=Prorocentrum cordatum TaxID=2364126 RepID=A0ABN9RXM7_9DINO|nr:unnamed protein product [Polarella glacialis]|mmetsp:Transcript_65554/g.170655  ORF Transcript_65554/g.170655 Transcript_65554/m.170655 type:complete len:423 (+) Transcript_65554:55-1323(+)
MLRVFLQVVVLLTTATSTSGDCSLRDFGAVGDGVADDSVAVAAAIAACANGGTVVVPAGRYLTRGGIELTSNMAFEVQHGATVLLTTNRSLIPVQEDGHYAPFLSAYQATNISIFGEGTLDGQGSVWWNFNTSQQEKPWFLYFEDVDRLRIFGVSLVNPPFWTVHPRRCHDVHIHDITISCDPPQIHFNTDGIDPDACTDVLIEDVDYSCGDDAVAIKASVQGAPGSRARVGFAQPSCRPTRNVTVRRLKSGGRGGFTIGSEMQGGIEDVLFSNCTSTGVSGIRISAQQKRGGYIRNVRFEDMIFDWPGDAFVFKNKSFVLTVDQDYGSGGDPCPGMGPSAEFFNFSFKNLTITHSPSGLRIGHITCPDAASCLDVSIDGLQFLDVPRPIPLTCANIHGSQVGVDPPENSACHMLNLPVAFV